MVIDYYQGPGRNIHFCLITTGLNIDPDQGGWATELYNHFKGVIQERAEIHYERRTIRELFDQDVSAYLTAYTSDPRPVYQFLYGLVEHNNGWTDETLTKALNDSIFSQSLKPQNGEFSIDFIESQTDGFKLFQNIFAGSDVWIEEQNFYYSTREPEFRDGDIGDAWLVCDVNGKVEIWYKPNYSWVKLYDYVTKNSPPGVLHFTDTMPANTTNSWWVDTTGFNVRKFNASINSWDITPVSISIQPTAPGSPSDGDIWIRVIKGVFQIYEYNAALSRFEKRRFSRFPVQDPVTNSAFVNAAGINNFTITCGDDALQGGPIGGGTGDLEIRKDGILIKSMVTCINFEGPDILVTDGGACVNVEHLPYTTFPEQGVAPPSLSDTGRVFTLDVAGVTELFYIDDSGNIIQLTNNGSTAQNIFFYIATTSALAGQTMFSLPGTARDVLTVKINGVDTLAYTFSAPTVTYIPSAANYTIQAGDDVTVIFYE